MIDGSFLTPYWTVYSSSKESLVLLDAMGCNIYINIFKSSIIPCISTIGLIIVDYIMHCMCEYNLIKNSQAVKKGAAPKTAMVKKDVKSKVAAKKWL